MTVPVKLLSVAILCSLFAAEPAAAADVPLPNDEDASAATAADPAAAVGASDDATRLQGVSVNSQYRAGGDALYLDERRAAPNVTEALGAEQIARTGDTDVATTLKRVTGLSVVDGKYVYVRGLGERYSSVLLNGAPIPSPDFTRRVVPLDLFPTELLDGILVDKTYVPSLPGDFGGGTVELRTREVPGKFFFRAQAGAGYVDGTTGEDGWRYDGGGRDWSGFDDGSRRLPDSLAAAIADGRYLRPRSDTNPDGATPTQLQVYGRDLAAAGYGIRPRRIDPDTSFSLGIGDGFDLGHDMRLGLVASARYKQSWETFDEQRHTYAASNSGLNEVGDEDIDATQRSIDASAFFGAGLRIGNDHRIGLTQMLLRQTDDRAKITDGTSDSVDSRYYETRWTENQLRATQLDGHHVFPALHDLELDWQATRARAGRDEPDTRRWRYDYSGETLEFSHRSDSNSQKFADLEDRQRDLNVKAMLPFAFADGSSLALSAGIERTRRDRASAIRTFVFQLAPGSPLAADPGFFLQPIEDILDPSHIGPDGFVLRETTRATDNYSASQRLDAGFVDADFSFGAHYRATLGVRRERNDQDVTTFSIVNPDAPPVVAGDRSTAWLPAASFTWLYGEHAQVRAAFSRTVARPDFRELSPAPYTDPELDIDTIGNPDLRTTRIRNVDLRWEYYFDESDSLAVALFDKRFDEPIERVRLAGSTPLLSFQNASSAHNYGVELDAYRNLGFLGASWFGIDPERFRVGFNYARIRSNVQLDAQSASFQTNLSRPMQGQSPYVANVQFGYADADAGLEATLLFNRFGRRISQVGVQGQPDIYEEAFDALDFQFRHAFATDWRWTLRLRNLLDPSVEYTQGGLPTRRYHRGREVQLSVEWRPGAH